jgi:peptidoglycan/xylan/chitin deacetylase (PgdA/CDA1 family)
VRTEDRGGRPGEVLNLCFHGIGAPARTLEPDEHLYWVEAAQFQELLSVIARYPSLRITFDDGNASDAALALPALLEHKLTAAFFLVASRLDQPGSLTRSEVRDLVGSGMTVGSHGLRHRPWRSVDDQELRAELEVAAEIIADAAGQRIQRVACPFGSYDRRVLTAIRRCGFSRVYTVDSGPAREDAWLQSRYTISSVDSPSDIERLARSPRGRPFPSALRTFKSFLKRWR